MEAMMAAIRAGDYAQAYDALRYTSKAATTSGISIGAFLLALLERFEEAERLAGMATLHGIPAIVRGERERTARWRDPAAHGPLPVATDSPAAPLYAALAAAFSVRDDALADRIRAELAALARPLPGAVTFADGQTRGFADIADADDAIGQMLEAYGESGLVYYPFASLRRIAMLPKRNFMDYLMPQAEVTGAHGTARVHVPLLYACSATAPIDHLRNGRTTMFEYLGAARRGRGQRDLRVDGALVGLQNIAAIDFR